MLVITKLKEQLEQRRAVALRDAELRHFRTEVLHILYDHIPKQEDLKARTDMIDKIATEIVEVFDETKAKERTQAIQKAGQ
jgi:DNA polymerase sigma